MGDGAPTRLRLGVIGDPIGHTLSPALHQPALDALGIPATFAAWHTPLAELPARIAGLRAPDALGASVTVPHKLAVIDLLDEVARSARRAGAVNTVVNRGGRLVGENTDADGFAASLVEVCADVPARRALVLGAGGAARAVVVALDGLGVADLAVANRDPARASALGRDLGLDAVRVVPFADEALAAALPRVDLLVNATALGWHPGELPIRRELLALLPAGALVADLTYRRTDLLAAAAERGLATLDGLGMLVHQGARAFTLWTGREAPLPVMLAAARAARDARRG